MVTNKDIQTLNEFLKTRNVDYVLTGTAALFYHGLLPEGTEVHDIDIIVITTEETRLALRTMFEELEKLSGCQYENEHYTQSVYIFKIGANNIKVNAFEHNLDKVNTEFYPSHHTIIIDGTPIKVHDAIVLNAKLSLRRQQKDADFCFKLINQLSSMFLCSKK